MAQNFLNIEFEHLLAHTFPGFFLAATLFMLLDIVDPDDLTLTLSTTEGLVTFIGFFLISGTALGILIDGVHHTVIEENIFHKQKNLNNLLYVKDYLSPVKGNLLYELYYYLPLMARSSSSIDIYSVIKKWYRYAEFYVNISISLVIFSLILPFYLFYILYLPWNFSMISGIVALVISFLSLNEGYNSYQRYLKAQISAIEAIRRSTYSIPDVILENAPPKNRLYGKRISIWDMALGLTAYIFVVSLMYILYVNYLKISFSGFSLALLLIGPAIAGSFIFITSKNIVRDCAEERKEKTENENGKKTEIENNVKCWEDPKEEIPKKKTEIVDGFCRRNVPCREEGRDYFYNKFDISKRFIVSNTYEITSSMLIGFLVVSVALAFSNPPLFIKIDPIELTFSEEDVLKTISIKNFGDELNKLELNIPEYSQKFLKLSGSNSTNSTRKNIKRNELVFFEIEKNKSPFENNSLIGNKSRCRAGIIVSYESVKNFKKSDLFLVNIDY